MRHWTHFEQAVLGKKSRKSGLKICIREGGLYCDIKQAVPGRKSGLRYVSGVVSLHRTHFEKVVSVRKRNGMKILQTHFEQAIPGRKSRKETGLKRHIGSRIATSETL